MTVQEVSRHLGLDWKTVKAIDEKFLEEKFGPTDYRGLCILAIDEVSIRKGHRYLAVVLDYLIPLFQNKSLYLLQSSNHAASYGTPAIGFIFRNCFPFLGFSFFLKANN